MKKNYIHILINKFFQSDCPEETQQKFQAWLLNPASKEEKEEAMKEVWENGAATADETTYHELDALHKRIDGQKRSSGFRLYLRRMAAILLLPLLGAFGSYFYLTKFQLTNQEPELKECFAPYGEQKEVNLPDGTKVWLNSGSLLVYSNEFKGNRRILFLNGEANFEVAKDPNRPFLVKTAHMTVEALGTVFCLNAYSDQDIVTATLEKGKIRVSPCLTQKTDLFLTPNEQIVYNHRLGKVDRNRVDAKRVLRWTDGYLFFQQASFDQIAKTIERKFNVTVNYETGRFAGRSFTMKFNPDEGLEQVLEVMKEMIKGFNYKIKQNKVYIN